MRTVASFAAAAVVLALSSSALADALPVDDCSMNHKKEGEACKDPSGKDGACGTITYSALNHATDPPTESQRSYLGCRAGDKSTGGAKAKSCSAAPVPAPTGVDGAATLLAVTLAVAAYRMRRRRC